MESVSDMDDKALNGSAIKENKKKLRRELLTKRDELTADERVRAKVLITERILGHQWYYRSEVLLAFVSYGSEIDTLEIIQDALDHKKKVFVPKIVRKEGIPSEIMEFWRISSLEDLEAGYKGIPEPKGDTEIYECEDEIAAKTLLLMPGVGFDPYGNRMGYGKGFYDRYLQDKEALWIRSIAIGHKCQLTEHIPSDDNDVKPYQVILV